MSHPVRQYLERYAEPESRFLPPPGRPWRRVALLPSLGEGALVAGAVESILLAASADDGVIVVLNSRESHPAATHAANEESRRLLGTMDPGRVRVIDRARPGHFLPEKEGVGLARKIGNDVALAWWAGGAVESPLFFQTDADARVPADWFDRIGDSGGAAWTFPFRHHPVEPVTTDDITLYELWLRIHRLGLKQARSPYAFQAIGSTMVVHAEAYAAARGYRKTAAGEDFYLLDKLAKIGAIRALPGAPIILEGRLSDRVPFGTGRAMLERQAADDAGDLRFPDPEGYSLLRLWIEALDRIAAEPLSGGEFDPLLPLDILESMGAIRFARETAAMNLSAPVRRRRLHTWFDAFRTLRFLHLVRDRIFPPLPWRDALARSPWLGAGIVRRAEVDLPDELLRLVTEIDEVKAPGMTAGFV